MKEYTRPIPMLILVGTILAGLFRYALINVFEAVGWDEAVYMGLGRSLYETSIFSLPFGLERFRPILLPMLISTTYHLNNPEFYARVVVLGFSTISIPAIYYLGRTLYSWKTGLLASLFLATNSLFIFEGQKILTESMYIAISCLAMALFYKGVEGDQRLLVPAAFLTALAALAKNFFGFFLLLLFLAHAVFSRKLKRLEFRLVSFSLLVFLAAVSPYFYFSWANYGNPLGSFLGQFDHYPPPSTPYPPYIYLGIAALVFGGNSIFIIAGLLLATRTRNSRDVFLLTMTVVPMLFLSATAVFYNPLIQSPAPERRFLMPFMPALVVIGASVVDRLGTVNRKVLAGILLVALVFSSIGLTQGYHMTINESQANVPLKQACVYLNGITNQNEVVVSPSYPLVYYYAERPTIKPPDDRTLFYSVLDSNKVRYVLIDRTEPDNPAYLEDELRNGSFIKIKGFQDSSGQERAAIYQYSK